ncbi:MAG: sulfatase-like hydrolase/transferase [Lutibacter sp.]|nr:sulfatase-like hydrolase/transferase [Lutibacter sp.]MBP9600227.1 sulfatase-like hydrolase/transferase [Lutibacter sp.]
MKIIKKYKSQINFHLILNFIVGVFITFSSYFHLPLNYISDYSIYFIHFLIIQFTLFGFLYILSLNKYIFYLGFSFFFIVYSLFSYWIYTLDISVSDSIMQAILESKLDIAIDLFTVPFLLFIVIVLVVLYYILNQYKKLNVNQLTSPLSVLAIIGIALFFTFNSYGIGNLKWRMPYNLTYGFINYYEKPSVELLPINSKVSRKSDDITIVFVLGESVRAKNLGLNGYYRNTTPLLSKVPNLVSFPFVYTPLTSTAISVPQILTNQSINSKTDKKSYSIYSVLNKVKVKTTWIGNQSPEKSYSIYINQNDSINLIDSFHDVFSFQKKLDENLLKPFNSILNNSKNQFITLHMIGSHWWYESRYTDEFRKFKPVIDSKHIPSLPKEQIVNSYDNTVLYLDYFLNETIEIIEKSKSKTILIYLSDHGEILGENGKWLHAQNDDASTNPAMIVWYSNSFKETYPEKIQNLKLNSLKKITTDFFYNSILDLLDIQNFEYQNEESIFNYKI